MLDSLAGLSKEDRIVKIQKHIKDQSSALLSKDLRWSVKDSKSVDINWKNINPIIHRISEHVLWITDAPTYLRIYVEGGVVKSKPFAVNTYDVTDDLNINKFIEMAEEKDVTLYSLVETDCDNTTKVILRCSLEPNPQKELKKKRENNIDVIINSFIEGDFNKILDNYKNIDLH